jgi:sec-independent protein translocase protein TatA
MRLGIPELILILAIVLLLFGTSRLAGLGKGLGQAIRGFKSEIDPKDQPQDKR